MEIFNGRVEHTQGESFTLDMLVAYPNGNPYIISSQLDHPYILFTIASTQFDQRDRYIMRHWLDTLNEDGTEKFPRFFQTRPNEELVSNAAINNASTFFAWLNANGTPDRWDPETGFTTEVYQLNNGTYWYGVGTFSGGTLIQLLEVLPYELRIVIPFSHDETKNMTGQKYVYFIEGVDGIELNEWLLQEVFDNKDKIEEAFVNIQITENLGVITVMNTESGFPEDVSTDNDLLYNLLQSIGDINLKDITLDQPIVITDATHNDIIVNDGEWKVTTNINGRGLNKWQTL